MGPEESAAERKVLPHAPGSASGGGCLFRRLLNDKSPLLARDRRTRLGRARLVLKLRALDARLAGETYREIALVLSAGSRRLEHRTWKSHDLRSWIIRLVRDGERLMRGGYRDLVQRG